ncbi:MFS transporter [Nonomuraea phyllanthi]|uniref:MFS transporter n=1 Tax=Nonomuraea phyllanthi TaxID=2219224 RepID=UPI001293622F|nr:MFS transporter [Nonomuraea phyllanthi]QFY08711.1 MFS transporter [Nonomuraea phyllanthi]
MVAPKTEGTAAPSPTRPARTNWGVGLLLFAAGVAAALQIGKAVAGLPSIRADLGLSLVAGGWVLAAVNVAGGLSGLLLGALVDRFGHRRSMLAGLVLTAASSALGAAAQDGTLLLLTRFGEGLGFVLTVLAVPPLLVRVTARADHGVMFGVWSSFMPTGSALGVLAAPVLLAHGGWRALWLAGAVLTAAVALAVAGAGRTLRPPGDRARLRPAPAMRAVLTAPGPLLVAGAFAAYALQYLAVIGFLPTLLTTEYAVPAATAALLTAAATIANAPGNLLGGWLRGRGAPRSVLICAGSALMGLSAVGIFADGSPLGLRYACCLLLSFAGGVIPATLLGAMPALAPSPQAQSATVGLGMQGSTLGQVAGPPLVAAVATATGGWGATPAVLGLAALIAFALGLALHRFEDKATP